MGDDDSWKDIGESLSEAAEPFLTATLGRDGLESAEAETGRFFILIYNSTTTVSAAYATFIALAIAAAIGAILGLIYWAFLSSKSESSSYEAPSQGYGKYKRSAEHDYQDELSFVKILQLIEKMELQLAAYQLPEKKSCPNKLFEICQIFENYRTSLLQEGIANSDDELLNEMVNEARVLLEYSGSKTEERILLKSYVEASNQGQQCYNKFCKNSHN